MNLEMDQNTLQDRGDMYYRLLVMKEFMFLCVLLALAGIFKARSSYVEALVTTHQSYTWCDVR